MKKLSFIIAGSVLVLMASCNSETNNDPKDPTIGERVDTTIKDVKSSTEAAANNLSDAADTTKNDIKEAAKSVKEDISDAYHDTKNAVKKGAERADEKTKEVHDELKGK